MIIIVGKTGQLANRLFLFAHLAAFAAEHCLTVSNPAFDEYASYFEGTRRDVWSRFPAQSSRPAPTASRRRFFYKSAAFLFSRSLKYRMSPPRTAVFQWAGLDYCELRSPQFQALLSRPLLLLAGWRFVDLALFDKHADQLRRFFQPAAPHRENVAALLQSCRDDTDVLVGVHIRRGDYKDFAGGRFFYSHQVYADLMCRTQALFPKQRVRFLLCSNEPVPAECFQSVDYRLGTNHLVEDLYALAGCDFLLGPESTYSMWASFYGQVPLYRVYEPDKTITQDDFVIRNGLF